MRDAVHIGSARRLRAWLFGYDVFISYAHRDGLGYACALENRLQSRDWAVFRDAPELAAGDHLEEVIFRALDRTRMLVVLVSPGSRHSQFMRKEVARFRQRGGRIVAIDVGSSLQEDHPLGVSEHYLHLKERLDALPESKPSEQVFAGLDQERAFWRWNRIARWGAAGLLASLTCLIAVAVYNVDRAAAAALESDLRRATSYIAEATRSAETRNHTAARAWAGAALMEHDLVAARRLLVDHPAVERRSRLTWTNGSPDAVACAPDSRWIAVGGADGRVRVLCLGPLGDLRHHRVMESSLTCDVNRVSFSPDESWLFAAEWKLDEGDRGALVGWPIEEGRFGSAVEITTGPQVVGLDIDVVGQQLVLLVVTDEGRVTRYRQSGRRWSPYGEPWSFPTIDSLGMYSATFDLSNDEMMVIWAGGRIRVFSLLGDPNDCRTLTLPPHPHWASTWDLPAACFDSVRREWIAGGSRDSVWRWTDEQNAPLDTLRPGSMGNNPDADSIADLLTVAGQRFGFDLVAISPRRGVLLWDTSGDRLIETVPLGELVPSAAATCGDFLVVVGALEGARGACLSLDLQRSSQRRRFTPPAEDTVTNAHSLSTDGAWLAAAYDNGMIRVWDAESGMRKWSWSASCKALRWIGFRPESTQIAAVGYDGTLRVWDVRRASAGRDSPLEVGRAELGAAGYCAAWRPDGRAIIAGGSFAFRGDPARCVIWDASEAGDIADGRSLPVAETVVERATWWDDTVVALIVDAGELVLRDVSDDRERRYPAPEHDAYLYCARTPHGELGCAMSHATVLYSVTPDLSLSETRRFPQLSGPIAFHPQRSVLAVPHGWDQLALFGEHSSPIASPTVRSPQLETLSFSHDGAWLIASGWRCPITWISVAPLLAAPVEIASEVRRLTGARVVDDRSGTRLLFDVGSAD